MSLLHKPIYTFDYDKEDDKEGLDRLLWSQFMCKCGKCPTNSGKNFMERLPVYILDDIAKEQQMRFDIELAYLCQTQADRLSIPTKHPYRVGLGVRIRLMCKVKRIKLIRALILRNVTRFIVSDEYVYFDCDDLLGWQFVLD